MDEKSILRTLEDLRGQHASTLEQFMSRQLAPPAMHSGLHGEHEGREAAPEGSTPPVERRDRIRTMLSSLSPSRVTAGMRASGGISKVTSDPRQTPLGQKELIHGSSAATLEHRYIEEEGEGGASFLYQCGHQSQQCCPPTHGANPLPPRPQPGCC